MIIASTFKCDRDGAEAAGSSGMFLGVLPEGWSTLNASYQQGAPATGHLCPACTAALVEFMNINGGDFLKPSTAPAAEAPAGGSP